MTRIIRSAALVLLWLPHAAAAAGPGQSPPVPDAVADLRTAEGLGAVSGRWRYTDARIVEADHRAAGADLRPTGAPVKTRDIEPRINTPAFDAAAWEEVGAGELEARRTGGRLAFGWYRLDFTVPSRLGGFDAAGCTIVLELVVDDYAEVWVGGELPLVLGQRGGPVPAGWNAPTRVVVERDAVPGRRVEVAVFAANGPLSDPPANYVWVRSATLDFYAPGRAWGEAPTGVEAEVRRLDPAMDAIVPPGARAELLASGLVFGEGPVWVPPAADGRYGGGGRGGCLLFSDPNQNVIHRYDPASGAVSIFRTKSGYSGVGGGDMREYRQPGSNGLALDGQGRLTICEHGNRRVTRLEPNGTLTVLADRFEGRRLNSPNDCVYRSDGALFFTDPPFGLPRVFDDPRKELPHSGVYCLYGGALRLASADLAAPNGLAFSPDEERLYVDNWEESRKVVMRYDVGPDGSLSGGRVFFDMTSMPGEIALDGLKVDERGNVYVAGPGGVWVISEAGRHLGTISLPELPANLAFGGEDGRDLYLTARSGLYRLRVGAAGARR